MAKSISDEELQLRKRARRRLVGAIALVTFIAVFLPMVLENEPKPVNQDISVQIPSQNSGTFTSKIVPVAPVPDAKPATAAKAEAPQPPVAPAKNAEPSAPPKAAIAASAKDEPKAAPVVKAEEKPAAATKPEQVATKAASAPKAEAKPPAEAKAPAKAKEPPKTTAYVVQIAALNDAEKAKQLQQQIKASGVSSYTEQVPTAKGSVTRVRAGPFKTREAAEKAREQLKGMGLAGNVVPK